MKKNILLILILIIFSIPAILPLFNKGFFQSDDGEWMIIRAASFYSALADGQFPVRYLSSLNYGYGYPVANFLYPGFMYLAVPIHILSFGFVDTIKIILGLSMVGSAVFSFLWLSKIFNKFSAFVGSIYYLYMPYHLFDLYKRGSVGEILALAIVPFILWQIERKSFFWTILGISCLIPAHNTLALLFFPIVIFYLARKFSVRDTLYTLIISLGMSCFFWIPALFDLQYTIFSRTKVSEWQNYFADINVISYLSLIILAIGIGMAAKKKVLGAALFLLIVGLISLFLSTSGSSFIWQALPISFVQFPFRFLSVEILTVSYLASFILSSIKESMRFVVGGISIILIFTSAFQYKPSVFFDKGDQYYATNEDTTTVKNEYMPIWVIDKPTEHYKDKVEISEGTISDLDININSINFVASAAKDTQIAINTIYFPGWNVFVDSNRTKIDYTNDKGIIKFNMASGRHSVAVYFSETPVRLISDLISLISLLLLFTVILHRERTKKI
ncbi:MAG: hypothetical protein HYW62_04840 [Candidatus Levybacteria bacterium]|nr:hypothetical protein [Candidatus Levybacteria bacterium]